MFSSTQTGAKLKLVINNKTVGIITGFSWSIDYGRKALRGIDNPFPQEMVSGPQTVRGSIQCVRLQGMSLESYGIVSSQGASQGADGAAITGQLSDPYISIALVDRLSSEVVFSVDRASVMNQQWSTGARGLLQGSFDFEGIVQGSGN